MESDSSLESCQIQKIGDSAIHNICSGQVITSLRTAIKELIENALDAGANMVEVNLKDQGLGCIEVVDNGCGIHPDNFQAIALKHHTSKLQGFDELAAGAVDTFGFRGEALSSLCALSDLSVVTRHRDSISAHRLRFSQSGALLEALPASRQVGTTVSVRNLFGTLPVRRKQLSSRIRREVTELMHALHAYAIICTDVRLSVMNQNGDSAKTRLLATSSVSATVGDCTVAAVRERVSAVFGPKQLISLTAFSTVQPSETTRLEYGLSTADEVATGTPLTVQGLVSRCDHGKGRSTGDRQFVFINQRPCDYSKVTRLVNELYRQYNRQQLPFLVLDVRCCRQLVDVNVTPDKRQMFLQNERRLLATVKETLVQCFQHQPSSIPMASAPTIVTSAAVNLPTDWMNTIKRTADKRTQDNSKRQRIDRYFSATSASRPSAVGSAGEHGGGESRPSAVGSAGEHGGGESRPSAVGSAGEHGGGESRPSAVGSAGEHGGGESRPSAVGSAGEHGGGESRPSAVGSAGEHGGGESRPSAVGSAGEHGGGESRPSAVGSAGEHGGGDCAVTSSNLPVTSNEPVPSGCSGDAPPPISALTDNAVVFIGQTVDTIECEDACAGLSVPSCSVGAVPYDGLCRVDITEQHRVSSPDGVCAAIMDKTNSESAQSVSVSQYQSTACILRPDNDSIPSSDTVNPSNIAVAPSPLVDIAVPQSQNSTVSGVEVSDPSVVTTCSSTTSSRVRGKLAFCWTDLRQQVDELVEQRRLLKSREADQWRFRARIEPQDNQSAQKELSRHIDKHHFTQMEVLGQFNLGFIVVRLAGDLFLIDQHASDEKYKFETYSREPVQYQRLVVPLSLELPVTSEETVLLHQSLLAESGFQLECDQSALAGRRLSLLTTPTVRGHVTDGQTQLHELVWLLQQSAFPPSKLVSSGTRSVLASKACRSAVMIGTALTLSEMRRLVLNMANMDQPWNCPHGRPTMRHLVCIDRISTDGIIPASHQ